MLIARAGIGSTVSAQNAADWALLDTYPSGSHALVVLSDGGITSRGDDGLYRSDDNGDSWQLLPSPPGGTATAADPVDAAVLYGTTAAGLFRSADGGATWQLIRAAGVFNLASAPGVAVGPADHNILLLVEGETILRSPDAGASWATIYAISHAGSPCVASVSLVIPHPTDPLRAVHDAGCYAGRNFGSSLKQTTDAGSTWSTWFRDGQSLVPRGVVGGAGAMPGRWYLMADSFMSTHGGHVLVSGDDGATWSEVLQLEDTATVGGIAYDPNNPDMVWVAVGQTPDPTLTGVRVSTDAGQSWAQLGRQDIGWVQALVLSADGSVLLAATNEGIWRYPVV